VEAAGIEHAIDPLAYCQPATLMLAFNAVRTAHFLRQCNARAHFSKFRLPTDRRSLLRSWQA
jgi:hypothetical protein